MLAPAGQHCSVGRATDPLGGGGCQGHAGCCWVGPAVAGVCVPLTTLFTLLPCRVSMSRPPRARVPQRLPASRRRRPRRCPSIVHLGPALPRHHTLRERRYPCVSLWPCVQCVRRAFWRGAWASCSHISLCQASRVPTRRAALAHPPPVRTVSGVCVSLSLAVLAAGVMMGGAQVGAAWAACAVRARALRRGRWGCCCACRRESSSRGARLGSSRRVEQTLLPCSFRSCVPSFPTVRRSSPLFQRSSAMMHVPV